MYSQALSKGDTQVLSQIFDPESNASSDEVLIDDSLPAEPHIRNEAVLKALRTEEIQAISLVERAITSPEAAEKECAFEEALRLITTIISSHPEYASARNNRCQLIRMLYTDHICIRTPRNNVNDEKIHAARTALDDLNTAIRLTTPPTPASPISRAQGKLLAQAHTQRAAMLYAAAKDLASLEESGEEHHVKDLIVVLDQLPPGTWNAQTLEEAGARDFFLGGRYGNEVARAMAVHTNPYAKLCGNIVKEAMRKEFAPMGTGTA